MTSKHQGCTFPGPPRCLTTSAWKWRNKQANCESLHLPSPFEEKALKLSQGSSNGEPQNLLQSLPEQEGSDSEVAPGEQTLYLNLRRKALGVEWI